MSDPQTNAPPTVPLIPLDELLGIISSPVRWRLLGELLTADQHMVSELAERMNSSPDVVSKHLAVLRHARVVIQGRNRLYQIAPQFIADKGNRLLDVGWCLLRMKVGEQR
jgi:DNA-binding transcriptional ArsR family regulator